MNIEAGMGAMSMSSHFQNRHEFASVADLALQLASRGE